MATSGDVQQALTHIVNASTSKEELVDGAGLKTTAQGRSALRSGSDPSETSESPRGRIFSSPVQTPESGTPQNSSPERNSAHTSSMATNGALKKSYGSGSKLATILSLGDDTEDPRVGDKSDDFVSASNGHLGASTAGTKSVQFSSETQDTGRPETRGSRPHSLDGDKPEPEGKSPSLYSRLRAMATSQTLSHSRSPSGVSLTARSTDGKGVEGKGVDVLDGLYFPMSLQEDDDEADDDADESATEASVARAGLPKRKRKAQRKEHAETAPSSPQTSMRPGYLSTQSMASADHVRPNRPQRRVTDSDMSSHGRQGMSEDEGRKKLRQDASRSHKSAWRGLNSTNGPPKTNESTLEGRRPLTLRTLTHSATPAEDGETPRLSKRRMMGDRAERGATLSAQKWKQLKLNLRALGATKKKEPSVDHEKSAELLAELAAGSTAALMIASMFQRDERGRRRIPILLEQLKVRITDSEVEKNQALEKGRDPEDLTPDDRARHVVFRIELEYGNGINRMKWVVQRSLGDFINLHAKYKLHFSAEKLKRRAKDTKNMPPFPIAAFPYAQSYFSRLGLGTEGEDEAEATGNDTEEAHTDNDRSATRPSRRASFGLHRRISSGAETPHDSGPSAAAAAAKRKEFAEKQRKTLEGYLQKMIHFMLFRADNSRLCRFLEVSALGVRLAAEGSYHGKEGPMNIQSAKGVDWRKMNPSAWIASHQEKWFLVRHSYVVCVDSPEEMHIYDVFLFDSEFSMVPPKWHSWDKKDSKSKDLARSVRQSTKQHHRLVIQNSERKLRLVSTNEKLIAQFEESIRETARTSPWTKENRFGSFAPVRTKCFAQWLVDGRDYMWVVSRAISQAKDVIYIHDWWLSPELYMRRPPAISQKWRLDRLLKRKAEEGVKVFVIVYRNVESAIPIDSQYTKFSLLDLHPNVFVQRSPNQFRQNTFFWAHHEKICIVDHTLAFIGGIDLCFGRWDTPQHPVNDDKSTGFEATDLPKDADHCQLWPGKDYSNPRVQDFYSLNKPYEEMYDRSQIARMPWHDVSMQVVGQPARDLTRHFVQRWNYILRQRKPTRPTPFLLPPPDFNPADLEALGLDGTCEVQILRSAGAWSLGTPNKTEHSIMDAYCKMIEDSEHFVYIENQFFISTCETEALTVRNSIGAALVERIARAHKNEEAWRAILVVPLVPGFQNTIDSEGGTSIRLIMQYQYRSICRGATSVFGELKARGIDPEDYIQFYALRAWGKIGVKNALVTEQLYIHAKLMIVDDRIAIIGSANINERSMLGNRDSECAAVVRDTDMIESRMNGEKYQVGRFPHTLRVRLMREHLGLDVDKIMEESQALEADHRERPNLDASSPIDIEEDQLYSPLSADGGPERADPYHRDIRDDLLDRSEELNSFNHDVDWSQAGNPNLHQARLGPGKVTSDSRVTANAEHRKDVEGEGFDNMTKIEEAGNGIGRDTILLAGNKEVLVSALASEGKGCINKPIKHGETKRTPFWVAKAEVSNPGLPPRPSAERMNTEALGLPMLSQLPQLPDVDDIDIGGPPALNRVFTNGIPAEQHPLVDELKRPFVDKDCMQDPIIDLFAEDTWHEIAENNTKIFRSVFRCMPDNEVKGWSEYREYVAYEERFNHMQGGDLSAGKAAANRSTKNGSTSGPVGAGTKLPIDTLKSPGKISNELEKDGKDLLSKLSGDIIKTQEAIEDEKKAELREWAVKANRAQLERQQSSLSRQNTFNANDPEEKTGLETVPEDAPALAFPKVSDEVTLTSESAGAIGPKDRSASVPPPVQQFVGYSEALNQNAASSSTRAGSVSISAGSISGAGGTAARRRRRGTLRSTTRVFLASDDIISREQAEHLLGMLQGNLVLWPYDWLKDVEAGGNWLYARDQITPLEI